MSLNNVDEQMPLFIRELEQFGDQLAKNIGMLSIEIEKAQASQDSAVQQRLMQLLGELQDSSNSIKSTICTPLADSLMVKHAQLKSYLYD